jgi:hypothetical protein
MYTEYLLTSPVVIFTTYVVPAGVDLAAAYICVDVQLLQETVVAEALKAAATNSIPARKRMKTPFSLREPGYVYPVICRHH